MKHVEDVLLWAIAQKGEAYVFGAEVPLTAQDGDAWDCCLAEGSLVHTDRGCLPIEEVEAGDLVPAWGDGGLERRKVVRVMDQGLQAVYRLRTRNRTVIATANHPFLVVRRKARRGVGVVVEWRTEWARLDTLRRGDLVVTLDHLDGAEEQQALSDGTVVTEDVAWLLGVLIGDGTVRRNDVRVCVFGELRDRVRSVITRTWGVRCSDDESAGLLVRRNHALSMTLMDALGVHRAENKRIPPIVWRLPASGQRAFLDGYQDADGHTDKRGYRAYHSASRRLVGEARLLHVQLGDNVSNLTTTHRRRPIVINGKTVKRALPLHSFQMYPDSNRRGQTQLDVYGARRAVPDRRFSAERVLGIDPMGDAPTWDIEVEGAHNFVAEGLVVHNSELVQWSCGKAGVAPAVPDGAFNQWSQIKQANGLISVRDGINTRGALLFAGDGTGSGRDAIFHVAFSLGDGTTIEARGKKWGVGCWASVGRFDFAGRIGGIDYSKGVQPLTPPPPAVVPAFPGTTKLGASGDAVRQLQQRLRDRGWNVSVDGTFGPATDKLVRSFQQDKRLEDDGVVGPKTWEALWRSPIT
jgi:hypothetical protein